MVGWLGEIEIKANSAQLKLELGLSLAIMPKIAANFVLPAMPKGSAHALLLDFDSGDSQT